MTVYYWVYDTIDAGESVPIEIESDIDSDSLPEQNIVTVYRPVIVETNANGIPYAYYYDKDATPEEVLKDGGKRYVPKEQVHRQPPEHAEPAYKYEQ